MNKSTLKQIEKQVRKQLDRCFSVSSPKLVIGVSGGPDSMALLHILSRLSLPLVVGHVNYEQRGEASEQDQQLVEQFTSQLQIPCYTFRTGKFPENGENFQQWARTKRFKHLRDLMNQDEAEAVVLAHHREDQIETILHKLFRGAGPGGWTGMSVYDPPLFRPLLNVSQKRIEDYLENMSVPSRVDESNRRSKYARNFLRNEWIPRLDEILPGWRENILDLPEKSRIFISVVRTLRDKAAISSKKLRRDEVIGWEGAVQKAVILRWIKDIEPNISVSGRALEEVEKLADLQTGQSLQIVEHVEIMRDRDRLVLLIQNEGDTEQVEFYLNWDSVMSSEKRKAGFRFGIDVPNDEKAPGNLVLDADSMHWPLTVRSWNSGDRFQPFGMEGHQKIKDHLTNRKVPAHDKKDALVLEDAEGHIAAVLFPSDYHGREPGTIADFVKCTSDTRKALIVKRS